MDNQPRLRMFAGPNGSGKSTLKSILDSEKLGVYINPDEINKQIMDTGELNFNMFNVKANYSDVLHFFKSSKLLKNKDIQIPAFKLEKNKFCISKELMLYYYASVLSDYIRRLLLRNKTTFTFETVMSSKDKVAFLREAQQAGYRTYLYFIATEDPVINIARVEERVKNGGHNVATQDIINRYYRSLDHLHDAILYSNRAYLFDNSSENDRVWLIEVTDAKEIDVKTEELPQWIDDYVFAKFGI